MAVADWTTDPYPAARLKRGVPSSAADSAPLTEPALAPRVRFWSQRMKIAANQTGEVTSPRFKGPAIIKDLVGSCVAGANAIGTLVLVQLIVGAAARIAGAEAGQNRVVPGVNISERSWIDSTVATTDTGHHGFIWRLDGAAAQMFQQRLDYVVYDTEFYLTVVARNPHTANGLTLDATIRVYEDCNPDALVLLMS